MPTRRPYSFRSSRSNPIIGKHPDLLGGETAVVVSNWRELTKKELRQAAEGGQLSEDDLEEIATEISQEVSDELAELDEEAREKRIEAFVKLFRNLAAWRVEYETEGEGKENYVDIFQQDLEGNVEEYAEKAKEFLEEDGEEELLGQIDDDMLKEVLSDPDLYDFEVNQNEYYASPRAIWSGNMGATEEEIEGIKYNEELEKVLEGLSEADIAAAMKKLENDEPYVYFGDRRWDGKKGEYQPVDKSYFDRSFFINIGQTEGWRMEASINMDKLINGLREKIEEEGPAEKKPGPGAKDEVVYEYSGSEDSVAGPFARGMFVVKLRPDQLKAEGAALKICVGREDMNYAKRLRKKEIALYSIRDADNKPRFTIEEVIGSPNRIVQVKGKVNRLPGFEGGGTKITRPDEVEFVVEFLLSLGQTPQQITEARDIGVGVRGLLDNGIDPFAPASERKARKNPRRNGKGLEVSPKTARMALAQYDRPWGGRWGT